MDNQELSQAQQEYQQQIKDQGLAFMGLINSDGWNILRGYYETQLKAFVNGLMKQSGDIEEFEKGRWELQGMLKLFGYVDSCIKELNEPAKRLTPEQ